MTKKNVHPTEADIKVLLALDQFGVFLDRSEYPKKTYFLVTEEGQRLGMYTTAEVTRWWKAGWIVCRQDDRSSPSQTGEFIITDAGDEVIAKHRLHEGNEEEPLLSYRWDN